MSTIAPVKPFVHAPGVHTPYYHPVLAPLLPLSTALAPRRAGWTAAELVRLTDLIVTGAPATLRRIARHDPDERWYDRLALTGQVEVWLIGWTVEQGTRPHDHGGAAGAYTVLDGRIEESFRDGRGPLRRSVLGPAGRSAFGPERVHLVRNPGPRNATSVHAYSPPLLPLGLRDALDPA